MTKRRAIQLDDAVQTARAASGTPEAVARLRARLDSRLAAECETHAPSLDPLLTAASTATPKLVVFSILGAVALGITFYVARHHNATPVTATSPTAPMSRAVAPRTPVAPPVTLSVSSAPAPYAPPAAAPPVRVAQRPQTGGPTPRRKRTEHTPPLAAASARASESEVELVARAQAAIDSQPLAARTLLEEHLQRFPRGLLSEERDVLRVDAELALSQPAQARELARAFIERYPRSAQLRRFQLLVASGSDRKLDALQKPTH